MGLRPDVLLGVIVVASACGSSPPGKTYFDRNIEPILAQKCAGNTSGCHAANTDDPYAFAAGNFDVTSFANVQKRRDLLAPFGPYQYPLLLIKAVAPSTPDPNDPNKLMVQIGPNFLPLDVLHAGGAVIDVASDAYFTLQTWMQNGATADGLPPPTPAQTGDGTCSATVPAGFDPTSYQANANFQTFKSSVQPILTKHGCVSNNCHGAPQSDFYITCGTDDTQVAFNFSQAWSFVDTPVDDSQILRIPLAVSAGGRGHTGGDQFSGTDDPDYATIKAWATAVGVLQFANGDPVKQFFQDYVQPVLERRGCMFEACHSPMATNDFKLRSGTQGFVSAVSLQKNYDLLRNNFLALEFPDARRGRAIAKTVLVNDYRVPDGVGGIAHRGGSVLESPGAGTCASSGLPCYGNTGCATGEACNVATTGSDPAACPPWPVPDPDPTKPDNLPTPFCTIQHWIDLSRTAEAASVDSMANGTSNKIVYVDQSAGRTADRLDFASPSVGTADLMTVDLTFSANYGEAYSVTTAPVSLLTGTGCSGITDVQGPDVAPDGHTVAFGGRVGASGPWSIYTVDLANVAAGCTPLVMGSGTGTSAIHNFDPAWSPDQAYVVFASTRGKGGNSPTVSRQRFLPQSDLWRIKLADASLEQMTFLSNSEISPQFMREGRVTMTTEKVSEGFYQLSGRRINWDLTDYHPLLAQRKTSPFATLTDLTLTDGNPSIGYSAATDIREGADGNFMLILSQVNADGSPQLKGGMGTLATFNRSIGPFEMGRTDPGYLKSVTFLGSPTATGDSTAADGYRAPFYMPDGQIMVSYAQASSLAWNIVLVDPRQGQNAGATSAPLFTPVNGAAVDAVLAYKYPTRELYLNRRQLVFGGSVDSTDTAHAVLTMPDAPMVFTLLTGNLRRGRPVDAFRSAQYLAFYSEGMCGPGCAANDMGIYQNRTPLGVVPLASDGSVKALLPAQTGVILELQDGNKKPIVTMREEHQLGPGEQISMGVQQPLFDAVCGGCHGSVSGQELDIAVTADALTGASTSMSQNIAPMAPQ